MGVIYSLEAELRELCKSPKENGDLIYIKLKELAGRLIARNTSKLGPDVDRWTLDHDIASYITTRICNNTIEPIQHFSGYIKTILPRMIKANAKENSTEIITGIEPQVMLEMSSAGAISFLKDYNNNLVLLEIEGLPSVIKDWMESNIRLIDKNSKYYENIKISIYMSIIKNDTVLFRLPKIYEPHLIVYTNKLRLFLARHILANQSENPIDQAAMIAGYEETEDYFGD